MITNTQMMTETTTTGVPAESVAGYSHSELKACVNEFIEMTVDSRRLGERCRDYYDGKQWTPAQIQELKRRRQAPIVNNRIKVKHNGLLGLTSMRKGDPKAYPRNEEADSSASEAATDGLRYAADKTTLNDKFIAAADNFFCEGYCGLHIIEEVKPDGAIEVLVDHINWNRIFFDAYSEQHDFSDARGKG